MILYDGPSMIDGSPIVAIATGLDHKSRNPKTGDMVQVWIIRADVDPVSAARHGAADGAICGSCPFRATVDKARSCYVQPFQAPLSVYRSYRRGKYGAFEDGAFAGRMVRLGAYGDPAAVPFEVWARVLEGAKGHTGYTHQWRSADPRFASIVMASCETGFDVDHAEKRGYRTFRVLTPGDPTMPTTTTRTIVCPASKERGNVTTCADCGACGGASNPKRRFHVVINQH